MKQAVPVLRIPVPFSDPFLPAHPPRFLYPGPVYGFRFPVLAHGLSPVVYPAEIYGVATVYFHPAPVSLPSVAFHISFHHRKVYLPDQRFPK